MESTIEVKVSFAEKDNLFVGEGELYHVPIGGLTIFEAVVFVDGKRAVVRDSEWQVQGTQIVGNSVMQTPERGKGRLQKNPVIEGGWAGNKDCIGTAWVDKGIFTLIITGTAYNGKRFFPFTIHGKVQVHCPRFTLQNGHIDQPTFDEGKLTAQFSAFTEYEADNITVGGTIGFLQLVKGIRLRKGLNATPSEICGSDTRFIDLDTASKNLLFYESEIANSKGIINLNDNPSQKCQDHNKFYEYEIGYPKAQNKVLETYFSYLAYKAPINGAVIESYIVVSGWFQWGWKMVGKYISEEGGWGPEPEYTNWDYCTVSDIWDLPVWENNSINLKVWQRR